MFRSNGATAKGRIRVRPSIPLSRLTASNLPGSPAAPLVCPPPGGSRPWVADGFAGRFLPSLTATGSGKGCNPAGAWDLWAHFPPAACEELIGRCCGLLWLCRRLARRLHPGQRFVTTRWTMKLPRGFSLVPSSDNSGAPPSASRSHLRTNRQYVFFFGWTMLPAVA